MNSSQDKLGSKKQQQQKLIFFNSTGSVSVVERLLCNCTYAFSIVASYLVSWEGCEAVTVHCQRVRRAECDATKGIHKY